MSDNKFTPPEPRLTRPRRTITLSAIANLPHWIAGTKRYLAGDIRAGFHAAASLTRWRARHFPAQKGKS